MNAKFFRGLICAGLVTMVTINSVALLIIAPYTLLSLICSFGVYLWLRNERYWRDR